MPSSFEGITILLLIVNGILMPITLYYVANGKQARAAGFAALITRLDHLDACIDALRLQVVGSGITRLEFEAKFIGLRQEIHEDSVRQVSARHDLATRVQVIVDAVEERLTRRLERIEGDMAGPRRRRAPAPQGDGE